MNDTEIPEWMVVQTQGEVFDLHVDILSLDGTPQRIRLTLAPSGFFLGVEQPKRGPAWWLVSSVGTPIGFAAFAAAFDWHPIPIGLAVLSALLGAHLIRRWMHPTFQATAGVMVGADLVAFDPQGEKLQAPVPSSALELETGRLTFDYADKRFDLVRCGPEHQEKIAWFFDTSEAQLRTISGEHHESVDHSSEEAADEVDEERG